MEIFRIALCFFQFDIGGSDKFRINAGGQDAAVYGGNTAAANQTGFHAFTPPLSVLSETLASIAVRGIERHFGHFGFDFGGFAVLI